MYFSMLFYSFLGFLLGFGVLLLTLPVCTDRPVSKLAKHGKSSGVAFGLRLLGELLFACNSWTSCISCPKGWVP